MNNIMQGQQYSITNIVIFKQQINIYLNIESSIINDFNLQCDKFVMHIETEMYDDINSQVINIIAILKQIIEKTQSPYPFSNNTVFYKEDSYFKALKSSLWFLEYINDNILEVDNFKHKIYTNFYNIIRNKIDGLLFNKDRFIFDWKLYEWLIQENYIKTRHITRYTSKYEPYFKENDLESFGKLEYKNIIDYIIKYHGDISDFNPFKNNQELAFKELYISFDKLNSTDYKNIIGETKCKEN